MKWQKCRNTSEARWPQYLLQNRPCAVQNAGHRTSIPSSTVLSSSNLCACSAQAKQRNTPPTCSCNSNPEFWKRLSFGKRSHLRLPGLTRLELQLPIAHNTSRCDLNLQLRNSLAKTTASSHAKGITQQSMITNCFVCAFSGLHCILAPAFWQELIHSIDQGWIVLNAMVVGHHKRTLWNLIS